MEKFRNLFTCGLLKLQEYNYFPGNIYPLTHKELPLFQRQRHHHNSFVGSEAEMNRPGFPGECFICELRLPDHRFRWKHNKLFLLLPEEYGPAFPA
ncbi:hypothetical protein V5066_19475, partial [Escherichia coli]|uniref:hypothetical protein n=1 Tax=Escherichia coli TaxID=562 RepID=UPI003075F601